ncbi:hypothetical protein F8745_25675 [Salmonella enterica]|nr:hypothetical protein [Salmonella enterica]
MLQVAQWLQACHDAGLALRVQVNESHTPEKGGTSVPVRAAGRIPVRLTRPVMSLKSPPGRG